MISRFSDLANTCIKILFNYLNITNLLINTIIPFGL